MRSTPPPRPTQANLAMGLILGGSVFVIASAWERISGLHSLEIQQSLVKVVNSEPFRGLTVSTLSTILRVLCVIGGGAATAAAILAAQIPKRSRSARIVLTVLAPLVFVGWLGTSGFFEPFVIVGIVMLWMPPTADWYVGRDPAVRLQRMAAPGPPAPPVPPVPVPPAPPASVAPTPPPPPPPAWVASAYVPLTRRPTALVRACVVVWVCCAVTAAGLIAAMVWLTTSGDTFVNEVIDQAHKVWGPMADNLTETQVRAELYVVLAGFLVWCVAAILLAVFVWFGRDWARILLAISSIGAGIFTLIGTVAFPPLLLVAAGCLVTSIQLLRTPTPSRR
jgi:hypothetical protein